jgi:GTP-binding protein
MVVNKWDLMAPHMPTEQWSEYLREQFPGLAFAPIGFISAMDGRNIRRLMNHAQMLFKQSQQRVSTPDLNRLIRDALAANPPPVAASRRGKIYYATQIGTSPPTIVLKCNDPDAFSTTYRRYLLNVLHDSLSFGEVPIRVLFDRRGEESKVTDRSFNESDVSDK